MKLKSKTIERVYGEKFSNKMHSRAVLSALRKARDQFQSERLLKMLRAIRYRFEFGENRISDESENANRRPINFQVPWYYAVGFLLVSILLFFGTVIPLFHRLPTALTKEDAHKNEFIAEFAYKNLDKLSSIGTKLTGTTENEVVAVNFILDQLEKIEDALLEDYFDMEVDLSRSDGSFQYNSMLIVYTGIQNIAVKLTPKNCTSETYLLVNSHFDSKPFTPSAGDAGFMIVTMLEVLRVLSTTRQSIEHPIVFLFNGAEEGGLQASHGFVTQHPWAPHCKAVINLDAAGSGGREVLFQTGPYHPWLVKYYKKYSKHPFGTTFAEEIFQAGILPSDTDFRQFRIFGNIPGLDLGQCVNGYIYHTKYDLIDVIPRESLQNTGDNVLSLVRGLANATELRDTAAQKGAHAIYFDFLGLFFIYYSDTVGILLNLAVVVAVLVLVYLSMRRIANICHESIKHVARWFALILGIQVIAFVLGFAFPTIVASFMDAVGRSLTYFSSPMLIIGLYVIPSVIGLSLPLTIYCGINRYDKISSAYHLQLALHAHAVIMALLVLLLTMCGIRSAYIPMIPLLFYVFALAINLYTRLHDRTYAWAAALQASQIIPFLYGSYIIYLFIVVLTPIGGRAGSSSNRDLLIAGLAALGTVLSLGFLVPLFNTFRRPSYALYSLLAITVLSMLLASGTPIGFPYRTKTNGQRVAYLQVRNQFYDYTGTLAREESGYLFSFQDRREEKPLLDSNVNLRGLVSINSKCKMQMMCDMPLYDFRYVKNRYQSKWLARNEPINPPDSLSFEVANRIVLNATRVRYEFNLTGPAYMSLFIRAYEGSQITDWSFLRSYLDAPPLPPLPYHIYITYGVEKPPLTFFVEVSNRNGDINFPLLELGVAAHFIGDEGDEHSMEFASSFPSYSILAQWPALYKHYIL